MVKDEARHTAVYEFDNNVAHSYRNVSVCMYTQLQVCEFDNVDNL